MSSAVAYMPGLGAAAGIAANAETSTASESKVPLSARLRRHLFGNPSVMRAYGNVNTQPLPIIHNTKAWERARKKTPVYALDKRIVGKTESLPRIWVSEPCFNERTGTITGRAFVGVYPVDGDAKGGRALALADGYYAEALQYTAAEDMALRTECFRAAEVLYLHAAGRGQLDAYLKLGMLYRDDLGEGSYWSFGMAHGCMVTSEINAHQRAIECFGYAASHGRGEACLYLAEMLACDGADEQQIILLLRRAFDVAGGVRHVPEAGNDLSAHGLAALALARAHENGLGCSQSFELALGWYTYAKDDLARAVDEGQWRYKRQACTAEMGARRMMQEIFGCW